MNIAKEVCISLLTDYFSTLEINEELWEEIPERARKVLTMNNNECVLYVLENYGIEFLTHEKESRGGNRSLSDGYRYLL